MNRRTTFPGGLDGIVGSDFLSGLRLMAGVTAAFKVKIPSHFDKACGPGREKAPVQGKAERRMSAVSLVDQTAVGRNFVGQK